ncbi:MAG: Gfo/Idh/MocA family protein [Thermodesulfobacteriota bacterium]
MSGKIRVGFVGAGYAAAFHYEAFLRATGLQVEVVGVTSLTPSSRKQFASQRGIRAFRSLEEMLDNVDVVDSCTSGYAHEPICITALEAGKHVIVEKPFTGFYGPAGDESFRGDCYPKEEMLEEAVESSR